MAFAQVLLAGADSDGAQDRHLVVGEGELGGAVLGGQPGEGLGDAESDREQVLLDMADAFAEGLAFLGRTDRDGDLVAALGDDRQGVSGGADAVGLGVVVEGQRAGVGDLKGIPEEAVLGGGAGAMDRVDRCSSGG